MIGIKRTGIRIITALVCMTVLFSEISVSAISGQSSVSTTNLKMNGANTGVTRTEISTSSSSKYGLNKINTVEFSLSNRNLKLKAVNCGSYLVSKASMTSAVSKYNSSNPTEKIVAAVNGDLWMTNVHSNSNVTTKVLSVPRGVMISNGEILCSQQIGNENLEATNSERGNVTPDKYCIGVTSEYQPLVGIPKVFFSLSSGNAEIYPDGLNRLPANDSLIIYNNRLNVSNYALSDAYEVHISASAGTSFTAGETVSGTVSGIYPSGTTKPAIAEGCIVLTARGNKISEINKLRKGDAVSISCSMTDSLGNTELWNSVTDAIGGHLPILMGGADVSSQSYFSSYPSTIVGIKNNGNVILTTVDGRQSGYSVGLNSSVAADLCRELGYSYAFMLDGGGSTEMICSCDGGYQVVNRPSDGSERAVVNMLAVVYTKTARAEQGALDYIYDISDLDYTNLVFDNAMTLLPLQSPNYTEYSISGGALKMMTSDSTNDPHITLSYNAAAKPVSADSYKYMLIRLRADDTTSNKFKIYFETSVSGISEANTASISMTTDGKWNTYLVDMSSKSGWKGNITALRLDYLDQDTSSRGEYVELKSLRLYKTYAEANSALLADNELPYKIVPVNFPSSGRPDNPMPYMSLVRAYYNNRESELITRPDFSVDTTGFDMKNIRKYTVNISYQGKNYPFVYTVCADPTAYTDVSEGQWFKKDVYYSTEQGIFRGTSDTEFNPDMNMTRAMFVSVLARLSGDDIGSYSSSSSPFEDANDPNVWFFNAVMWANENSITNGISETEFAPDSQISREQMCVLISRFAGYMGYELRSNVQTAQFDDYDSISEYARSAVDECRRAGIVSGMGDNKFDPHGKLTRAQAATITARLYSEYIAEE